MKKIFYITTAIDYPSADPHMGHAYEKICADVIARWNEKKGKDVFSLTGTDEHGQKIENYASKAGKTPKEFVEKQTGKFKILCKKLNIRNDDFIRTTEPRHTKAVQDIFKKLEAAGDVYKGKYKGLYCTDCEAYYLEKDLEEGLCPTHKKKPNLLEEETYFFKLSKYQKKITKFFQQNPDFVEPAIRKNEMLNRLKDEVRDLCISRTTFKWGIPVPGDDKHVIFVWVDALTNYLSGAGYPGAEFKKRWPADIHIIGKDILWFHSIIWPSILMSCGLDVPKKVLVHGFVNVGGQKMSKSKGVVIDPIALCDKYGTDALRYFLMREIPFGEDGNFSEVALIKRINSDLANDLGNLLHRVSTMTEKYFEGVLPKNAAKNKLYSHMVSQLGQKGLTASADRCMEAFRFNDALDEIWKVINAANKSIEDTKPWILSKEGKTDELAAFMKVLVDILMTAAENIYPFMPDTANEITKRLTEGSIKKGKPLFPRIEESEDTR